MSNIVPNSPLALGLYVHVPFCARRCDFCAFYEREPRRADIARYMDGVLGELATFQPGRRVGTVFWGGGTPGILTPLDMERLGLAVLEGLRWCSFGVDSGDGPLRPCAKKASDAALAGC
jgi:oxygen-independent coproporphyrinogen-3 oxidase